MDLDKGFQSPLQSWPLSVHRADFGRWLRTFVHRPANRDDESAFWLKLPTGLYYGSYRISCVKKLPRTGIRRLSGR